MIVVTMVCVYLGAWRASGRWGPEAVINNEPRRSSYAFAESPMPLLVRRYDLYEGKGPIGSTSYYLWLFGPVVRLPYSVDWYDPPYDTGAGTAPVDPDDPFGSSAI